MMNDILDRIEAIVTPDLDTDPDYRWGVEAVLRQALLDLESGAHVGLMIVRLKRALASIEQERDARHGEPAKARSVPVEVHTS